MSLRSNAAALAERAGGESVPSAPAAPPTQPRSVQPDPPAPATELADEQLPEPVPMPEAVLVHVAWWRVMCDVQYVAKDREYKERDGGPVKYKFRGVDDALLAFGPACRRHGVLVLPVHVDAKYRDTKTAGGKSTRECTVLVTYKIIGPKGDNLTVQAAGESLDSGDKGTGKAQSTALRTLLFGGGLVPTGDPDPDESNLERVDTDARTPESYATEVLEDEPSKARMLAIRREIREQGIAEVAVLNEKHEREPLGTLVDRKGFERFAPAQPASEQPVVVATGDEWQTAWAEVVAAGAQVGKDEAQLREAFPQWEGAAGLIPDDAGAPMLRAYAARLTLTGGA